MKNSDISPNSKLWIWSFIQFIFLIAHGQIYILLQMFSIVRVKLRNFLSFNRDIRQVKVPREVKCLKVRWVVVVDIISILQRWVQFSVPCWWWAWPWWGGCCVLSLSGSRTVSSRPWGPTGLSRYTPSSSSTSSRRPPAPQSTRDGRYHGGSWGGL